ncbi:hypothetical protein [Bosea sp. Root670]|uniref:hypothetical protein n=1 Tax=Bosea sp. Root670 TaxID=1736583 RepID=UPI0012E3F702|nr:hypothetical protein [Bosea sp. Root670]
MSELTFGDAPKNGKRVVIKPGTPPATAFHVEVWIDGRISATRRFATSVEAEQYRRQELMR